MNNTQCEHQNMAQAEQVKLTHMDGMVLRNYKCKVCSGPFATVERSMADMRELEENQRAIVEGLKTEIDKTWALTQELATQQFEEAEHEEVKNTGAEE